MAENTWVCLGWKNTLLIGAIYNSIYNDRLGGPPSRWFKVTFLYPSVGGHLINHLKGRKKPLQNDYKESPGWWQLNNVWLLDVCYPEHLGSHLSNLMTGHMLKKWWVVFHGCQL